MSHSCPDCGALCYCDLSDMLDESSAANCVHPLSDHCTGEQLDDLDPDRELDEGLAEELET